MISIIVPVYDVEAYIHQCIDSIINQTYKDIEILLIDDGSPDNCGKICDEYAKQDSRIRVFHTENRGLSAARNLGLEVAKGEYIGFVDSDDWIEPDMYELLLKKMDKTGADVVECGWFQEYSDKCLEHKSKNQIMTGKEAVNALLRLELYNGVWNRLWKRRCYENIRFPDGRIHEDVATTFRIFSVANYICCIDDSKYHYLQRAGSLSNTLNMNYITSLWLSHKERYDYLFPIIDRLGKQQLKKYCAFAMSFAWAHYHDCSKNEQKANREILQDMNLFAIKHISLFGEPGWNISLRFGALLTHYCNPFTLWMAWLLNHFRCKLREFIKRNVISNVPESEADKIE